MKMSRSTDYAIRLLLYLSKANTRFSLKLVVTIGISARYLLQVGAIFGNVKLITVTRGLSVIIS